MFMNAVNISHEDSVKYRAGHFELLFGGKNRRFYGNMVLYGISLIFVHACLSKRSFQQSDVKKCNLI